MSHRTLTVKQRPVYEFIKSYLAEHKQSPYIHEIQTACGIHSYKSAIDRLVALERKGFIKRAPNKHRSIRLVKLAIEEPIAPVEQVSLQQSQNNQGALLV